MHLIGHEIEMSDRNCVAVLRIDARATLACAFVFTAAVFSCGLALGQSRPEDVGLFGLRIEMPASVPVPATRIEPGPPTTTWRSFVELAGLRLNLHFTNESDAAVWVNRGELRKALQFRVARDGTSLSVDAAWLDEMLGYDRLPVQVPSNEVVLLEPAASVRWTVAIRRTDEEAFGPGDYRVTMELRNIRAAVRDASGEPWKGRVPPDATREYIARVQLPTTTSEAAQGYILDAEERAARDEFASALTAYSRAADVNPADPSGILGMAHMNVRLGRYRDAIQLYEKAPRGVRDDIMALFLARAYIGAGEEAKAVEALRAGGAAETEIPGLIQDARDTVRADRSRFDRSPPGR